MGARPAASAAGGEPVRTRVRPWGLVVALACAASTPASAHSPSVAHVEVRPLDGDGRHIQVDVDVSLRDLAMTLPLDADRDERITWGELLAARPALESLVADGVEVSRSGGRCRLAPEALATRRYDDGAYAALRLRGECRGTGPYVVRYQMMFDRDAGHRAIVSLTGPGAVEGQGVDPSGGADAPAPGASTGIARAGAGTVQLDPARPGGFIAFLREGVHHILIGYDHIAFLLSLLLPAMLVWTGLQWAPAGRVRPRVIHVVGLVTAFTVAHSLTLTLAALGWVRPAGAWIEAVIAASVILAALNNLRPVVTRRLWLLAFGFGLVHGFGFAGALGEIGLPRGTRLEALLGFNLGVELGQLAIVAVLLPLLAVLRGRVWYSRRVLPIVSLAIAMSGAIWLSQRLGP
jgi:hypothetical protein